MLELKQIYFIPLMALSAQTTEFFPVLRIWKFFRLHSTVAAKAGTCSVSSHFLCFFFFMCSSCDLDLAWVDSKSFFIERKKKSLNVLRLSSEASQKKIVLTAY